MSDRLFAKSPADDSGDSVYLANHLDDVFEAACQLLACTGSGQLEALALCDDWRPRFEKAVKLAAVLHDLGKANDHFQGMIDPHKWPHRADRRQSLRHEWVTGIIIREYGLADWLMPYCDSDPLIWNAAMWAIQGHHPKPLRPSPPTSSFDGGGTEMKLLLGHRETRRCLQVISACLSLGDPPTLSDDSIELVATPNAIERINECCIGDRLGWRALSNDQRRFTAAVKACVIAADVAGSALPAQVRTAQQSSWIRECFQFAPSSEQLQQIVNSRLTDSDGIIHSLRPFQRSTGDEAAEVTFVKAGCGSGKTLAAYYWALRNCVGQRLYFCYPTTGTATEGFRDYLVNEDEHNFGAELFHSRATADLEMLVTGDDEKQSRDSVDDQFDTLDRIESLASWSTPIVSCTVDTVLGLVQNQRRSIYAWPAIARSAFVFDEIHAYDDRLFSALLHFLKAIAGVPVLLMTASLPAHRMRKLDKFLGTRMVTITGPEDLEDLKRYHRVPLDDDADPIDRTNESNSGQSNPPPPLSTIRDELARNGKVLWVCNTVDRVMKAAELVQRSVDMKPIIYHSRFRYEDRVTQHGRVICQFKSDSAALAITSQVCEMSLDLSATLLVTDLAPIPAVIQRLGRLNRRATPNESATEPLTMPFVVIDPNRDGEPYCLPYKEDELEATRRWLDTLPNAISQRDLIDNWHRNQEQQDQRAKSYGSTWLDGGPRTEVGDLRDPSHGITVVMQDDLADLQSGNIKLARVLLPMPQPRRHLVWKEWSRHKGVPVAPADTLTYDASSGGKWN